MQVAAATAENSVHIAQKYEQYFSFLPWTGKWELPLWSSKSIPGYLTEENKNGN